MSNAANTPTSEPVKKRLTTSAMIASIASEGQATKSAPFGHALASLADQRQDIVGLSADLSKYTDLHIFAKAHPDRFYQMGMAEQLLMSAAAGIVRAAHSTPSSGQSPRKTLTSKSFAVCPASLPATAQATKPPMTWQFSAPCPT